MLSTLFTLGIYVTGLFSADIREFGDLTRNPLMKSFTQALYYLLPNFHNFNAIAHAAHGEAVPFTLIAQNTLYAFLYVALLLLAASAVFSRRDLK
jgi:hypothetical protein